jgi:sacsin
MKEHLKLNKDYPAELDSFRGVFQGYSNDIARNGYYKGTLFRFPLRKRPSEISKTLYGEEKIMELFQALKDRAFMNLLFLKSLETIEVYVQDLHETEPRLQLRISIGNRDMLQTRARFFQQLQVSGNEIVKEQRHVTYQIDIQTQIPGERPIGCDVQSFLVCHYYDGRNVSSTMQDLLDDEQLSYQPLVGVAMPLTQQDRSEVSRPTGHIFCFLPLPIRGNTSPTGLPVHVSSFFVVSSNRSEIKWPTAGQIHAKMSDSLKWNNCLLTELIPRAYAQLLFDATEKPNVQPDNVCHAFPDFDLLDEKWKVTFLLPFMKLVLLLPILPAVGQVKRYVSVKDSALCPSTISEATRQVLVRLLTDTGRNAVCLPEHMLRALKSFVRQEVLVEATANFVCQVLRKSVW